MKHRIGRSGQNMTETILLLPAYLLLVFGVLQMGQLGTALLVADYAASAVARQVVQDQTENTLLGGNYMSRFEKLMTAGMKKGVLEAEYTHDGLFYDVTVHACAQINVMPFLGELLLKPALGFRYRGNGCAGDSGMGPFSFSGSAPYFFTVHGKATLRMNYQPR